MMRDVATMAEIGQDYPERLAALREAMGGVTFAEFTERLAAGVELLRAASGRTGGAGEASLDQRWEWHLVHRLGMPDTWVRGRCRHGEVTPVEALSGEVVAQLCLTCDTQFPAPDGG